MGMTDRIWGALTAMVKLEDKVSRQAEAAKAQQLKIEGLTERVIRLEAQVDLMLKMTSIRTLVDVTPRVESKPD